MERQTEPGKIKWKKVGGGSLTTKVDGKAKIIKPGQTFLARPDEIPETMRDTIVPVDDKLKEKLAKKEPLVPTEPAVPMEYTLHLRGGGYYDVVDANGKAQNEKALRKDAAEALIESLME